MKVLLALLALTIMLSPRLLAAPLPPGNDDFMNRVVIPVPNSPPPIVFTNQSIGRNTGASKEPGEPENPFNAGGKSVWWSWTAPTDGDVRLITDQSTFDTLLGVYTGSTVGDLTLVAAGDDHGTERTSRSRFRARAGMAYQIVVDGYANPGAEADSGNIKLVLTFYGEPLTRPPNDLFANAAPLAGQSAEANGLNVNATRESDEPDHAGESGDTSVWWAWTAPATGSYTVSTEGSSFDTLLAVYAGTVLGNVVPVAANDNIDTDGGIFTSRATFNATAGVTYRIAVDGFDGGFGTILLHILSPGPQLSNPRRLANGAFEFTLQTTPGRTNEIQVSEDLNTWSTTTTLVPTNAQVVVTDLSAINRGRRFYRAILKPPTP